MSNVFGFDFLKTEHTLQDDGLPKAANSSSNTTGINAAQALLLNNSDEEQLRALAARVALPTAPVVAVMGDGSVGFHIAEFDTAVRHSLGLVAVVGNDARWNAEHQIQLRDYGPQRLIACELNPTRYDAVAAAFGAWGGHVAEAADMASTAQAALVSGRPACVNVMIEGLAAPVIQR